MSMLDRMERPPRSSLRRGLFATGPEGVPSVSREVEDMDEKKKGMRKGERRQKAVEDRPHERKVEFAFRAPDAKEVYLAGDFNGWDTCSIPMKRHKTGVWKVKVKLNPGRYEYKLFADGNWVHDLPGAERVPNRFGTDNFVVRID